MTCYGVALVTFVSLFLGESIRSKDVDAIRPARLLQTFTHLLQSRTFVGYMLVNCALFGGLGAYLSGVSFVVIQVLAIPTEYFGFVFGTIMLGNIIGYTISGRIVMRLGLDRTLQYGVIGVATSGVLLAGFAWAGIAHVVTLIGPMMLYMCCFALSGPQAIAGALTPFPHAAGAASSLMGFFQSLTSASVGMGVAIAFDGTPRARQLRLPRGDLDAAGLYLHRAPDSGERAPPARRLTPGQSAAEGVRERSAGKVSVTLVPMPTVEVSRISPACSSTSALVMASPRPEPSKRRVSTLSTWSKGWKQLAMLASAMPMPVSSTAMVMRPLSSAITRRTRPPGSVNLTALESRLSSICLTARGSA